MKHSGTGWCPACDSSRCQEQSIEPNPMSENQFKYSEAYPSAFISALDLGGKEATLTIAGWRYIDPKKDMGEGGRKIEKGTVLKFEKAKKEFVCNVTNFKTISQLHGVDPDTWAGKKITLYPTTCRFGKDPDVPCVRVKI